MRKKVGVFGSALTAEDSEDYRQAREAGRLIAESGFDLLCGGYGGSMEAVARGCAEAGGKAHGIGLEHFTAPPNRHLSRFRKARTLGKRLDHFAVECDLFLALPGGIGTAAEVMFVWDLAKTGQIRHKPILLYGRGWENLLRVLKEEFIIPADAFGCLETAATPGELNQRLRAAGQDSG